MQEFFGLHKGLKKSFLPAFYCSYIYNMSEEIYQQNHISIALQLRLLAKRKSILGWLRFICMLLIIGFTWLAIANSQVLLLPLIAILIASFIYLLNKDLKNSAAIENCNRLQQINITEMEALAHRFTHLPDGLKYKPHTHAYANDLDIFGNASLFQYINRAISEQGNEMVANWLLSPPLTSTIIERQAAVKELAQEIDWRQQLQAHGMASPITVATQNKIHSWLQQDAAFLHKNYWHALRFLLPAISFTILGLHLSGYIDSNRFYPLILLCLIASFAITKLVMPAYMQLDKIATQLSSLSESISWIEQKEFKSTLLQKLKASYAATPPFASEKINRLKKILDRFDLRLNPVVFIPLNTFLFWDLQQILFLEKWRADNKQSIGSWFNSLAEIESLCSLGNLYFNNPDWCFPALVEKEGVLIAEEIGHPLIPKEKSVVNSFSTEGLNQLNLITGSNMAGKSTFLRSCGVNIVLAMMGSAVYSSKFSLSPMQVLSSMRVSDNLEESTSTFYAELKKLKEVIDAVYKNKKVFLLLDEILRGTNSADRHAGSMALIKQLIKHNAAGIIATHDLELAKLADEFACKIHNYHFDVQVANDELYFDYKLKRGVCRSMNASILMKKIGIEM
jgi:MutS domain V